MQVGRFELVAVDHADAADASAGQVLKDRDAEAAAADYQHSAAAQPGLACRADFLECDLARVVGPGVYCAFCGRCFRLRWRGLLRSVLVMLVALMVPLV